MGKTYTGDSFKTTEGIDLVTEALMKDGFVGTATDLQELIVSSVTGVSGKSIVPTDTPTGVGVSSWVALQSGTYTNFGGLVVNAASIAVISRDSVGAFSISQTAFDISSKVNISDVINSLTSAETTKPLSAAQGKILNEKLFNTDNSVSWDGTISFNQTTKAVAITAGTVFTKDGYKGATSSESVTVPSGDYIIVYLDNSLSLHFAPFYTYDKSLTNIILARLDTNGTNVIKINYCLNRDYILDGKLYKGNVYLPGITTSVNFKESAENSYKIVTTGGIKQMQISAGIYFLSDKSIGSNGYIASTAQNLDFTLDYNYLFYNYQTGIFKFIFYAWADQTDFDNSICLGLFFVETNKVWGITASGIGYSYNGIPLKSSEVYIPNGIKYAQIGDSITIKDNKYETDIDYVGGLTGYQDYGYGRRICEELKIPYENHYPQGKNGYSSGDYVYRLENDLINFPDDITLYSIFIGTNDWGTENINLGTTSDYINNTYTEINRTSYGAFRKIIDNIIGAKSTSDLTHPKIILMTPMLRGSFGYKNGDGTLAHYMKSAIEKNVTTGLWQYTTNSHGFTLKDIADLVKWVADYEGFHCIDLFYDGFIDKRFLNIETTWSNFAAEERPLVYNDDLLDNLHPTTKGYDLLYSRIIQEFKRVIKK